MKFSDLDQRAWRVGFLPQPWEWSDWRWAGPDGRFNSRWDPLDHGLYRTVYAAESLLACLVELLAPHRPDPYLVAELEPELDLLHGRRVLLLLAMVVLVSDAAG